MSLLRALAPLPVLAMVALVIVASVRPGGVDLLFLWKIGWWIIFSGIVATVVLSTLIWNGIQVTIDDKAAWLHGAALDLIKAMENSGPGGAESRAGKAEQTAERFAVVGIAAARRDRDGLPLHSAPGPMGFGMPPSEVDLKLTDAGLALAEIYRKDAANFRRSRGAVRNAALVFIAIVQHSNILSAHAMMTEYMKAQRDDEARSLPGWPSLKLFLDLPTTWPTGDAPERAAATGRTMREVLTAFWALKRVRRTLFKDLSYRTPVVGDRPSRLVEGDNIIKAIREFTRTDDTGQAFL